MILSDTQILSEMAAKRIVIEPFDADCLGSNSYDVHLGHVLATYRDGVLDAKKHNEVDLFEIGEGFTLRPGVLYLGSTVEYTETLAHVPFVEGKSSTGRLGISIHAQSGKGDVGYKNHWTLEITVAMPVVVYAGMPVGQIIFHEVSGRVRRTYDKKAGAKYATRTSLPTESMMWKNFRDGRWK